MDLIKKIIYLDWNIIKGIKAPTLEPFISLKKLLIENRDKIIIPFSSSHIEDLDKNYVENQDKIDSDLNFLQEITQGNFIHMSNSKKELEIQHYPVLEFFENHKKDQNSVKNR